MWEVLFTKYKVFTAHHNTSVLFLFFLLEPILLLDADFNNDNADASDRVSGYFNIFSSKSEQA